MEESKKPSALREWILKNDHLIKPYMLFSKRLAISTFITEAILSLFLIIKSLCTGQKNNFIARNPLAVSF
jgi:hypothetical protein